jgi:hypothetical protein
MRIMIERNASRDAAAPPRVAPLSRYAGCPEAAVHTGAEDPRTMPAHARPHDGHTLVHATRIQLICPCGNDAQVRAAREVIAALLGDECVQRWGGITYSGVADPSFIGAFWNEHQRDWEIDRNVLILIDAPGEPESACRDYAVRLHDLVARIYAARGEWQRRLWVSVHPVTLVAERPPHTAMEE